MDTDTNTNTNTSITSPKRKYLGRKLFSTEVTKGNTLVASDFETKTKTEEILYGVIQNVFQTKPTTVTCQTGSQMPIPAKWVISVILVSPISKSFNTDKSDKQEKNSGVIDLKIECNMITPKKDEIVHRNTPVDVVPVPLPVAGSVAAGPVSGKERTYFQIGTAHYRIGDVLTLDILDPANEKNKHAVSLIEGYQEEWKKGFKKGQLVRLTGVRGVSFFSLPKPDVERVGMDYFKNQFKDVQYRGKNISDYSISEDFVPKCSFYMPKVSKWISGGGGVVNDLAFSKVLKKCIPIVRYEAKTAQVVNEQKFNIFQELSVLSPMKRYLDVNIRDVNLKGVHSQCRDYLPDEMFTEKQRKNWDGSEMREFGDKTRMLCEASNHSGIKEVFGSYLSVIDPNVFGQSTIEEHAQLNRVTMNDGEEYECCDICFIPDLFKFTFNPNNMESIKAEVIHRMVKYKDKNQVSVSKTCFSWKFAILMKRLRDSKAIKITFSSAPGGFLEHAGSLFRCQYLGITADVKTNALIDTNPPLLALMRHHLPFMKVMIHSSGPDVAHFLREKDNSKDDKPCPNLFVAGRLSPEIEEDEELTRKLSCDEPWMDLFMPSRFRMDLDSYLDLVGIPIWGPSLLFDAYGTMGIDYWSVIQSPQGFSRPYYFPVIESLTNSVAVVSTFSESSHRWNNLAQACLNKEFPIQDPNAHKNYDYVALFAHSSFHLDSLTDVPCYTSLSEARRQFIDQWILSACPILKEIGSQSIDAAMDITEHILGIKKLELEKHKVETDSYKLTPIDDYINRYAPERIYTNPSNFTTKLSCVIFFRPKKDNVSTATTIATGSDIFQAKKPDPVSFLNIQNLQHQDLNKPLSPIDWKIDLLNQVLNPLDDNPVSLLGKRSRDEDGDGNMDTSAMNDL